ncbi:ComEA family DNA-binding protein [Thermomonas sp.]|uniref:ComEA family DNA-binding protein n=1 Tax=Thermomonas sp. TaxID=1971895 RepID=UPI0035B04125
MKPLTFLFATFVLLLALAGNAAAGETVNINTADAATLDRVLVNVGPVKAQAIVDYRQANGAFRSPEQLAMVKGIGLRTVERNRDRIVVSAPRSAVKPEGRAALQVTTQQVARR